MATASPKLLLVEDDKIIRITVRDALTRAGYKVAEHSDGAAALRAAESEAFDLVLTDVRLPGLDGISFFRRIAGAGPLRGRAPAGARREVTGSAGAHRGAPCPWRSAFSRVRDGTLRKGDDTAPLARS